MLVAGEGYVLAGHNEQGFTAQNVHALCDVGASTKQRGTSIGHKGIGFKSVFMVSDQPHVLSREFAFCFDVAKHGLFGCAHSHPTPRNRALTRRKHENLTFPPNSSPDAATRRYVVPEWVQPKALCGQLSAKLDLLPAYCSHPRLPAALPPSLQVGDDTATTRGTWLYLPTRPHAASSAQPTDAAASQASSSPGMRRASRVT